MSKFFEALENADAERGLVAQVERVQKVETQVVVLPQGLPPLQMEREMVRLYHSITALHSDSKKNIFQFISSQKDEGNSTILREFGRFLSEKMNKSILIIDADSFEMDQHYAFGVRPGISLQQIMTDGGPVDKALVRGKQSSVLLCRLLEDNSVNDSHNISEDIREVWIQLRNRFDYILIDSPPMNASEEALALCSSVDGVILVIEAEKTRFQVVSNTKDRIIQNGGNILGAVFNKQRHYIPEWLYKRL